MYNINQEDTFTSQMLSKQSEHTQYTREKNYNLRIMKVGNIKNGNQKEVELQD